MRLGYVIQYVEDVVKTVEFYERAFGLKRLFIPKSNDYAEMETGPTKLAFASFALGKEDGLDIAHPCPVGWRHHSKSRHLSVRMSKRPSIRPFRMALWSLLNRFKSPGARGSVT
jgi:hypothetical protein